jgi:ribonuclease P/MRP protein subunit RPP1
LYRVTLAISDTAQNYRMKDLNDPASGYDILAVRPIEEKTLEQACRSLDCDIISLDLTVRYPFHFHTKHKILVKAIERGIRIELCYGPGITALDRNMRKQLIENATAIIRTTRGRGIIISSEAATALQCRAPADIVNLAALWGLGQERGVEAVTKEARSVVVAAQFKRTSYRGVIDVVYGGEKPVGEKAATKSQSKNKRKAADMSVEDGKDAAEQPLSKTQIKKRAFKAKQEAAAKKAEQESKGGADSTMADAPKP